MPSLGMLRFDEIWAMVQVKYQYQNAKINLRPDQTDLAFCYDVLSEVSRSFAAVIVQLNPELQHVVCVFYLVLRGLDTVEDDMSVPLSLKKEVLPTFHEKLYDDTWSIAGIGKGKERELLEKFGCVAREFQALKQPYRDVISDICERMANGMIHFLQNEVVTKKDYDLYCHYVAGLVGHGLTRLFAASGLEDPHLADDLEVANSMGLFLQKANIIRDYYEDIVEEPPRMFWPKEIWGHWAENLADFKREDHKHRKVECLNAMVADALQHVPHCVEYMSRLKESSVFLFCSIPQVMAIATLAQLYDNPEVFHSKVKIRKGLACKIITHSTDLKAALQMFAAHCAELEGKLREEDPSYDTCRHGLQQARLHLDKHLSAAEPSVARKFLLGYPALGGRLLYECIDYVRNAI